MTFGHIRNFHFIGIGGTGMSALAELLLHQGFSVTGSDLQESSTTRYLQTLGAVISIGHDKDNLGLAETIVFSSAVPSDNPELIEAERRNVVRIHRSELLAELMRFKVGVTVSGTHGKTTTASMLSTVLLEANLDPTFAVGAKINKLGSNARSGSGRYFIAEADESDKSFLNLRPVHTIVTNIDRDHMDHYSSIEDLRHYFAKHLESIPFFGKIVICLDDPNLISLLRSFHRPVVTYGLDSKADFSAVDYQSGLFSATYRLLMRGEAVEKIRLNVPGIHNVLNSLAVAALAVELQVPLSAISQGLERFGGVERRLERKGECRGVLVLDDYAHHPAEIGASLKACKESGRRILLVFQPHRYSRTKDLASELSECFEQADHLFLLDIYSAGEEAINGVNSEQLSKRIAENQEVTYVKSDKEMLTLLKDLTQPGDLVLTMGAGDVWKIGEAFLEEV
jgi:UDP-N-acetylmuramate--alanine ligase